MTLLGRVHRVGDVGALRKARRLAAQTVPRAARQTRCERPQGERETRAGREPARREADALPPRRRPPHHDEGRLIGVALLPTLPLRSLCASCAAGAPHSACSAAFCARHAATRRGSLRLLRQLRLDRGALHRRQLAVDKRRQRSQIEPLRQAGIVVVIHHGFLTTFSGGTLRANPTAPPSTGPSVISTRMCSRARESRDITVPIGTPSAFDAS